MFVEIVDDLQVGLKDGSALLFPQTQLLISIQIGEVVQLRWKFPHSLQQRVEEIPFELFVLGHTPQSLALLVILAVKLAIVILLEGDKCVEVEGVPLEFAFDRGCSSD